MKIVKELSRRDALGTIGALGAAVVAGCSSSPTAAEMPPTATPTPSPTTVASGSCAVSPTETIGPYPNLSEVVRSDITEGKAGLPVTLTITVVNAANACAPVGNAAVEIWQCTSNASDMVFADGVQSELATLAGSPTSGYTAAFTVGVSV
jgi:hypothetical protein